MFIGPSLALTGAGKAASSLLVGSGSLSPILSLTRTQASGSVSTAPAWAFFAADAPRFRTDNGRLLIEPSRTNLVRNPRFEGSITPGVVGSGAVLPTNVAAVPVANQTLELIGLSTVDGVPALEFQLTTSASSGTGTITIDSTMAASGSTTYAASVLAQLVSGSVANLSNFGFRIRTSTVTVQAGTIHSLSGITSGLTRFSGTQTTLSDATNIQLQVTFASTAAASIRFRIAAPQVELGAFAASPVYPAVSTPATSARGADIVAAARTALGLDAACAGVYSLDALLLANAPAAGPQVLLTLHDGTANNAIIFRNAAGGASIEMLAVVGGVAGTPVAIGTMTAGTLFALSATVDGTGGVAATLNGGAVANLLGCPTSGLTTVALGASATGGDVMAGEVARFGVVPFGERGLAQPAAFGTPADAEYAGAWWLKDSTGLGDLERVWGRYSGATMTAMWLDSGIAYRDDPSGVTADLDVVPPKYDTSRHVVIDGETFDGARIASVTIDSDGHGTSTSKIAASAVGGGPSVGVAPGLRLTCVHVYNPATKIFLTGSDTAAIQAAVSHYENFPVGYTKGRINLAIAPWRAGIERAAATGRGGLGTVIASPAANATTRLSGNLRYLQVIGSIESTGWMNAVTNWSSAMLASCPAPDNSFTSGHSAAMVGVNAMILEANPNLGWRDVKEIVSLTALHAGSAIGTGPTAPENGTWIINGAQGGSGRPRHWHQHWGFGRVDAQGAVGLAEAWRHLGLAPRTSANEIVAEQVSTGSITFNDANPTRTRVFTFADNLVVETVVIAMNTGGAARTLQNLAIQTPFGTVIDLGRLNVGEDADGFMRFSIEGLRGELAAGNWTVATTDTNTSDGLTGTWASAVVTIYGHTPSAGRQHVMLDDLPALLAFQPGYSAVNATNNDTLMGAALSGNATMNLATGNCTIAGQAVTLSGTFPAAFGGWGNDTITGSNSGCLLAGGYGNDSIVGGTGADTIIGGPGADTLTGGSGNDVFRYTSVWDSPVATPDRITDFNVATDVLDFAFGTTGAFVGTGPFTRGARQARAIASGSDTNVYFDIDGDGRADLLIVLTGSLTLTSANFRWSAAI